MARASSHRRLPAEEARLRILDAAERQLSELGPEGLRLTELAKELGISHPAILHHFGSREELVHAVVARSLVALHVDLLRTFATTMSEAKEVRAEGVLHRVAETLEERGQGRLITWLILSGREPPELASEINLKRVVQGAHAFRRARTNRAFELEETAFFVELTSFALLGDAVFGERMRKLEGMPHGAGASRNFRERLGELLERQLQALNEDASAGVAKRTAPKKKRGGGAQGKR